MKIPAPVSTNIVGWARAVTRALSDFTGAWGTITGTLSAQADLQAALDAKQATLVSGTNIKTVNGNSLVGAGDVVISGGGGALSWVI